MLVFQRAFLSGLHRIAVKDSGPPCAVRSRFHVVSSSEFRAAVCKQDMDIFSKKFCSENRFQKVNVFFHGLCSLLFVIKGEEDAGIYKFEGLDKGVVCLIVINGVHLGNKNIRIFGYVFLVIFVGASFQIFTVCPLFVCLRFLFGNFTGYLTAQIHDGNSCKLMEYIIFDIVIESLFRNARFRVTCNDLERGQSLLKQGLYDISHNLRLLGSKVYAFP